MTKCIHCNGTGETTVTGCGLPFALRICKGCDGKGYI